MSPHRPSHPPAALSLLAALGSLLAFGCSNQPEETLYGGGEFVLSFEPLEATGIGPLDLTMEGATLSELGPIQEGAVDGFLDECQSVPWGTAAALRGAGSSRGNGVSACSELPPGLGPCPSDGDYPDGDSLFFSLRVHGETDARIRIGVRDSSDPDWNRTLMDDGGAGTDGALLREGDLLSGHLVAQFTKSCFHEGEGYEELIGLTEVSATWEFDEAVSLTYSY